MIQIKPVGSSRHRLGIAASPEKIYDILDASKATRRRSDILMVEADR
jgi:hypothetical protein